MHCWKGGWKQVSLVFMKLLIISVITTSILYFRNRVYPHNGKHSNHSSFCISILQTQTVSYMYTHSSQGFSVQSPEQLIKVQHVMNL